MTNPSTRPSADTGAYDSPAEANRESTPNALIFASRWEQETAVYLAALDFMLIEQVCLFSLGH